ncbi:MAG TPA: DNA gyrase subunit A [Phycisphaerae bacterium]|nr:DNA gyrase subunit A [Phycisphaerae bacterium]
MTTEPGQIRDVRITTEMQDSYLIYAISTLMDRALPDARDGLKPSQRRILVAMNDLRLGPRSKQRKCAKIAGDTSGNYHPHGEQVIYPTLVRLAQPWVMRYPLIDGQGNFGTIDGDPPAAMRYTEARMASPAMELLADLNLGTVDFEPNYDETRTEPVVLPGKLPNLLVNGSTGIAVSMATNMPPHNLSEVCDAVVALLDNPNITVDELMKVLPGPDFPTGGLICGREGIRQAYHTGRGQLTLRARLHTEEKRGGRVQIVVDEIPYQILKSTVTERAAQAVKDGRLADVADIRDESDRKHPIRFVVELRKDANPQVVINQLYKYTPLQSTVSIINIALMGRQPRTLNLKQLLEAFVDHRKDVIRRRTRFLLRRARHRAHILEGLILAVGRIDEIIELIRKSPDPAAAKVALMEKPLRLVEQTALRKALPEAFAARCAAEDQFLTAVQADAILTMQLQRLTGLEIDKLVDEYVKLCEEIEGYEAILRDELLVLDIIREDMYEMKGAYGDERRTQIMGAVKEFRLDQLIAEETAVVTISHEGYVKRTPVEAYRRQGRGGRGVIGGDNRQGDFLQSLFVVSTHDYLLFFTNRGRVYWLRVYDIPSMARTSRGRSLANLLNTQPGEKPTSVLAVGEFEERFVVMATARGVIKKTPLGAFSHPRPSGIIAVDLDAADSLIGCAVTGGRDEILLGTRGGLSIRFREDDVRAMGRAARGVKGIALARDDEVVDMAVVNASRTLLTVCENGYGKRTAVDEHRLQSRGGKGVINIRTTERNGKVVAVKSVTDQDELMMITTKGMMLRTAIANMRVIGRATQGVRLIRLEEGDKLVAVARIAEDQLEPHDNADGESELAEDDSQQSDPSQPDQQPEGGADTPAE